MKAAEQTSSHATASPKTSAPFFNKSGSNSFFGTESTAEPFFSPKTVQPKLTIGSPNDVYEQQADAVADQVVAKLSPPTPSVQRQNIASEPEKKLQLKENELEKTEEKLQMKPIFESLATPPPPSDEDTVQRKCADCDKEDKEKGQIQKKNDGDTEGSPSADLSSRLSSSKGGGSLLSDGVRGSMESAIGADFSGVRVHTSSESVQMNRELNAQAFAHGNDVYFGAGKYNPSSSSGQHLLAHELVHTVQQGAVQRKMIQKQAEPRAATHGREAGEPQTLEQRAAQEAIDGHPLLSNSLARAMQVPLSFNFNHQFDGDNQIAVHQGGGIQIQINASFTDSTIVPTSSNIRFRVQLRQNVSYLPDTALTSVGFSVGGWRQYTWNNLPAGDYYLHFEKTSSEDINGTAWVDVLSGQGQTAQPSSTIDQFEQDTGIISGSVQVPGVAYGEFVLRSEPIANSFIFGTLPGNSINVRILEKRSFNRDGSDSWYKIAFVDTTAFSRLATEIPPHTSSLARQMYDAGNAWVTATALKIYMPYSQVLAQIRAFERQSDVRVLTLEQRITMLRQLYVDSELRSDDILQTSPGTRMEEDRPDLSNIIQMLHGASTGVLLQNGESVDFGHFILTLDAYRHPDRAESYHVPMGSTRAVSSWSGDVGAAVADYTIDHENRGLTTLNTSLLDQHFERGATNADLLGNLDGLGASLLVGGNITTIEQLVRQYYEGITITLPIGSNNAFQNNRALALQSFLGSYGFTNPQSLTSNVDAVRCIGSDSLIFAIIWYLHKRGVDIISSRNPTTLLGRVNAAMIRRFLTRLETFAVQFSVTTIPTGTVRAVSCPVTSSALTPTGSSQGTRVGGVPTTHPQSSPTSTISRKLISSLGQDKDNSINGISTLPEGIQRQITSTPQLQSVIFKRSTALMRAFAHSTVSLSPTSGSSDSIVMIQQALNYLNIDSNTNVDSDGVYRSGTVAAVQVFQTMNMRSPTPTGNVDTDTLRALDTALVLRETNSPNSSVRPVRGNRQTRFLDYPQTYISSIAVDLSTQQVTLTWSGPAASGRDTGPFECSPGRGILSNGTCNDCDNITVSQTAGTNCTPKGTDTVDSKANFLSRYPEAMFVTFFDLRRGVAFHYYPSVPDYPASHGCVRLHLYPAILIYDNVVSSVTQTNVFGSWSRRVLDTVNCELNSLRRGLQSTYEEIQDFFSGDDD